MTKTQRRRAHRKPVDQSVIRIEVPERAGSSQCVAASVVDIIDGGFGVTLTTPLRSGSTVVVRGKPADGGMADHLKAAVRWCVGKRDGSFRAGLEFLANSSPYPLDCYEVMQLSPNADGYTISRVYRMLASRYHPDNTETGDSEKFIRLSQAHEILSDPEKRAKFDSRYRDAARMRAKIFEQAQESSERDGNERKFLQRVQVPGRGSAHPDHFAPTVGALRGWNTALRTPGA